MFRTRQVLPALFAFAAFAAAGPTAALAQACVGVPAANGQFAVSGAAAFEQAIAGFPVEDVTTYRADLTANVAGPMSVGLGYATTQSDAMEENVNSFSGSASYERPVGGVSACATTGATYMSLPGGDESAGDSPSFVTVPVGVGLGKTFRAGGSLNVTPFAVPQFVHMRFSVGSEDAETATANEFAGLAGLRVGVERFYVSGDVSHMFVEGAESVFSVGAGVIF